MPDPDGARETLVRRVAHRLEQGHWPRLSLGVILTTATLSAFLVSRFALAAGLGNMAIRYGVAALVGYLIFLGCVRLWVARYQLSTDPILAAPEPAAALPGGNTRDETSIPDSGFVLIEVIPELGGELPGLLLLVLAVALFGAIGSTVAIVLGAPTLLAEVAIDGLIAGAAYRRLVQGDPRHWVRAATARTWKAMLAIVITAMVVGYLVQWLVPGALSIGDIFRLRG